MPLFVHFETISHENNCFFAIKIISLCFLLFNVNFTCFGNSIKGSKAGKIGESESGLVLGMELEIMIPKSNWHLFSKAEDVKAKFGLIAVTN